VADLPDINPLRQVWPVRPGDRTGEKKPAVRERPGERERKKQRERPGRDDDQQGHIDEYA
jgi:hypothetical protein